MPTYFEDMTVGMTREVGERTVTSEEIIDFAMQFDPQPIHTDEAAAQDSPFGGLIASGWHTAAVCMRILVDHLADEAWVGARGANRLRWVNPLRPGDTISVTVEVVDKDPTSSLPGVGSVDFAITGTDQSDQVLISWIALSLIAKRPDRDG